MGAVSVDAYATEESAVEVYHSPARASSYMTVGAALLAVLTSGPLSGVALVIGVFGLLGIVAGLFAVQSRGLVTAGAGVIFLGIVAAGLFTTAPPALLVVSTLLTVVAFDLGQNAFSVGAQLSEEAETTRGELVHAAATLGAGTVVVTLGYGVFLLAASGLTVAALGFVLLGGVLLAWGIRS